MLNFLRAWLGRSDPSAVEPLVPTAAPPAMTEALEARVAGWFAGEPPEVLALALDSLPALVGASPRFLEDTVPNETPLAWLGAALDRLEALPEPLPVPPRAPALPWRYLIFTRALGDALEADYGAIWRRGLATRCPLTRIPDPCPAPRPLRPPRERVPPSSAGLGALLAGRRLPEAGQQRLYEAMAAGVNWVDATAFWRLLATGESARPTPDPATAAETTETMTPTTAPRAAATPAETAQPAATPPKAAPPSGTPTAETPPAAAAPVPVAGPPSAADPLDAVARAALATLLASPRFNHHSGDTWFYDGAFYVAAKPFAEQLQAHPWVQAQPELHHRKALYRHLAARKLIVPHGGQKVWPLFVTEHGQTNARYVSALKLPSALYEGPEPCPVFGGTLREAGAAAGTRAE